MTLEANFSHWRQHADRTFGQFDEIEKRRNIILLENDSKYIILFVIIDIIFRFHHKADSDIISGVTQEQDRTIVLVITRNSASSPRVFLPPQ